MRRGESKLIGKSWIIQALVVRNVDFLTKKTMAM